MSQDNLSQSQFKQPMLPGMGGSLKKWGVGDLNRRHGRFRLNYSNEILDAHKEYPFHQHKITATANGTPVGHLVWDNHDISTIEVAPRHRRKGIATAMYDMAKKLPTKEDIYHSETRTEKGDAWAKTTSSYFPAEEIIKPMSNSYAKPRKKA
jgi:hypothetical protein